MKSPRIETKPKDVVLVKDRNGVLFCKAGINLASYVKTIAQLRAAILKGVAIPDRFYRPSSGRDYLLEQFGWIHLHIDNAPDDDVLLIVEQDATSVYFIAVTDHTIFDERPRGKSLYGVRSKLAKAKIR